MPVLTLAIIAFGQISTADLQALRKYRYGLTAAQIETMGQNAYERVFATKTPDHDAGVFRGVAYGVYVDAYRENTGSRYRAQDPPNVQSRRLAIDRQMRLIGVLFARNDSLFTGGNAVDPEGDTLEYAKAERRLYSSSPKPDEAVMRIRFASYRSAIMARALREPMNGVSGEDATGRRTLRANLGKLDAAVKRAQGLCKTSGERGVVIDFVVGQTLTRR